MKAVDLGDKILKSYKMNRKTQKWPTKLVFHFGNMAMMNAYLLWRQSQQMTVANMAMQVKQSAKVLRLTANLNLLSHADFWSTVVLALVEEGNHDHAFNNPARCILMLHPEHCFNDCHFPKEIVPKKVGGGSTAYALNVTKSRKASTPNFVVVCAINFCVHGHVSRCTTPKASLSRTQSKCVKRGWPHPTTMCPPILTVPCRRSAQPNNSTNGFCLFVHAEMKGSVIRPHFTLVSLCL